MKVNNDLLIWLFIILLLAFIFGLYSAENHRIPDTLYQRTKGSAVPYIEHYSERSSGFDVMGGASGRYGWGTSGDDYQRRVIRDYDDYQLAEEIKAKDREHQEKCKKPENKSDPQCVRDDNFKIQSELCNRCDILTNPDIDKYVLKSSVPPCPNLSDYIKKSEIPACKNANIDMNDYVKKSEIPAIPKCPECPKTECPKPTNTEKSSKSFNYNVVNTQDIEMLLQDKRVREYLDANYEKKNNVPKPTTGVSSAQSLFGFDMGADNGSASPSYNKPTTTLWGEIKSFFGFCKAAASATAASATAASKSGVMSEESRSVTPTSANFPGQVKDEETKMVYNQGSALSATDAQNCNTKPSDMQGMYAGDSLYSTV
jgi:hypothetical protein